MSDSISVQTTETKTKNTKTPIVPLSQAQFHTKFLSFSPLFRFSTSVFQFRHLFSRLFVTTGYTQVASVRQWIEQEVRVSTLWFLSVAPCFSSFSYAPTQVLQGHCPFRCVVSLPWSTSSELLSLSFHLLFPLLFPSLLSSQIFFSLSQKCFHRGKPIFADVLSCVL